MTSNLLWPVANFVVFIWAGRECDDGTNRGASRRASINSIGERAFKEVGFEAEDSAGTRTREIDRKDSKAWRDEETHRIARDRKEVTCLIRVRISIRGSVGVRVVVRVVSRVRR